MRPLILHDYPGSGNCYKARLTAALLGLPLERRVYDMLGGKTRTEDFLGTVNNNGRVPVLQVADRYLPESNAICLYLAEGSRLIPADPLDRADMYRWMFFEQNGHEPHIATLRLWLGYVGEANLSDAQRAQVPAKRHSGEDALRVMNEHLAARDWFAGNALSLADIALYAYTHVAEEGGFALDPYPHVRAWLARIAATPGYIALRD
jgi:glutathione S-transferase